MRTYSLLEKQVVQKALHTYNKRYEDYKKDGKTWEETLKITRAIRSKKKTLALLEEREKEVIDLAKKVEEFVGRRIFHRSSSNEAKCILAKNLFYKMGLELSIKGSSLAWYTGCEKKHPERQRRSFQRTFSSNKTNKETWVRFKTWYKNYDDNTTEVQLPNPRLSPGSTGKQQTQGPILETGG